MKTDEREKNIQYIKALNNAYQNHQLVIFYGAGLSKPLGLPDWGELIDNILGQFMKEEYEDVDNEREKIKQKIQKFDFWNGMNCLIEELNISGEDLKEAIVRIISESEQLNCGASESWEDNNYKDLAKMNINLFLTTNYDKIFPKCLNGHCETIDFMKNRKSLSDQLNTAGDDKKIFYLHGIIDDPSSIVISEDDVEDLYSSDSFLTPFSTILNSSKVLFIGVSFKDRFLREFLKAITSHNKNALYAMVLEKISEEELPVKQILVESRNPVISIRGMLEEIGREIESIVILRVTNFNKDNESQVKKSLSERLNIFRDIKISHTERGSLIFFLTFKKNWTLEKSCNQIKETIEKLAKDKILDNNKFVCFISQNTKNNVGKQTGILKKKYMEDQTKFLIELVSAKSYGFIIDKISLDLLNVENRYWIRNFTEKKGVISENKQEYSIYSEESIRIQDSHNSGTEVHVAGIILYKGKIVLEKRSSNEASVPNKYSLPGGRVEKGEMFRKALERIMKEKYDLVTEDLTIVDEFKVHDANIPGLAFGVHVHDFPASCAGELFTLKRLNELQENQLACSKDLIKKAFKELNKKEKIKLRIIMLTKCVYSCRCCHHENIKEIFNECQVEKVKSSLEKLQKNFDIQQITITGGEPLLPENRDNLLCLLSYIRNKWKKIDLSIITNAYYLNDACINELNPFNIRYKISLYGYDKESFEAYTRFNKEPDQIFDYIGDIEDKIRKLYQSSCSITLNIPLNKTISMGLKDLLLKSELHKTIVDCGVEIKIIEMVKPRREAEYYENDFVEAMSAISELGAVEENVEHSEELFNTSKYNINEMCMEIYKYPCGDYENCNTCFNNFALTVKPNGEMLICKRALENNNRRERVFSDAGINVEKVNLGEEYGIYHPEKN